MEKKQKLVLFGIVLAILSITISVLIGYHCNCTIDSEKDTTDFYEIYNNGLGLFGVESPEIVTAAERIETVVTKADVPVFIDGIEVKIELTSLPDSDGEKHVKYIAVDGQRKELVHNFKCAILPDTFPIDIGDVDYIYLFQLTPNIAIKIYFGGVNSHTSEEMWFFDVYETQKIQLHGLSMARYLEYNKGNSSWDYLDPHHPDVVLSITFDENCSFAYIKINDRSYTVNIFDIRQMPEFRRSFDGDVIVVLYIPEDPGDVICYVLDWDTDTIVQSIYPD